MKISGVYTIKNQHTGRMYVGSSVNIRVRIIRGHFSKLRKGKSENRLLQGDWDKYGEDNFTWMILQECNVSELKANEQIWINKTENRYNLHLNSTSALGFKHTKETKEKLSLRRKQMWADPIYRTAKLIQLRQQNPELREAARLAKLRRKIDVQT